MMNNRIKSIEELTFTDDGMFQAVLHEPAICAKLVERLLHINVNHVDYPKLEKTIAPFFSTKGVRLDVYLKDQDKIIDVEMQSYPMDAIGRMTLLEMKKKNLLVFHVIVSEIFVMKIMP